ncbi:MAG: SAM-dependent methyltransferase, partial [Planctomycetota bacterium]
MSLTSDQLWLLSSAAESHLALAQKQLAANENILKIVQRLRKSLPPAQSALTMELAQLRLRAVEKFPLAEKMFLTTRGYEQATSGLLAEYKAQLLPRGQRLLDLCCGIGGDLAGFSRL